MTSLTWLEIRTHLIHNNNQFDITHIDEHCRCKTKTFFSRSICQPQPQFHKLISTIGLENYPNRNQMKIHVTQIHVFIWIIIKKQEQLKSIKSLVVIFNPNKLRYRANKQKPFFPVFVHYILLFYIFCRRRAVGTDALVLPLLTECLWILCCVLHEM